MSKAFPMEPHEYSGAITYPADLEGSPCMGGKLIIPWDYTSMLLGSDLGYRFGVPADATPSPRCWRPFLCYFRQCRIEANTAQRREDRLTALEREVAELRLLIGGRQ